MAATRVPGVLAWALGLSAWLAAGPPSSGASEPGRITGHVRLGVKQAGRPVSTESYSRHISTPGVPATELTNVLVWVKDAPAAPPSAPRHVELRQADELFVPHVVAVTTGSTVSFPNDDPIFHNVFSLSRAATFDLGRYRQGTTRQHRFTRPGIVKVFCHLHSHMSAIVAVFDHPWFAQAGDDGTFAIDGVPPGAYTLTGWHERAGHTEQRVVIAPGGTTRVELLVPIDPA